MRKALILCLTASLCTSVFADEAMPSIPVTAKTVEQLAFYPIKSAPAKVITLNHAKIPAQVGGIIERFNHRVGDTVKKGDIIARLDCQDITLTLARLEADVKRSQVQQAFNQREMDRAVKLNKNKSVSESELDLKQTNVATGKSQIKALKINLKQQHVFAARCNITAPFDGIVTKRIASIGEQVDQGKSVVELLESGQQEVSAQIALSDQNAFLNAREYWFEVNGEKFPLKLRQLIPMIADNSRSLESRLEFVDKKTYSGVTGRVKWHTPSPYLPGYLLQKRENQYGFFVIEQDSARFVSVDGAQEGRPIKLGANANYQIIIDGRFGLRNSQNITLKTVADETLISRKGG
jgi:RND family efflux transporter MFP subunit